MRILPLVVVILLPGATGQADEVVLIPGTTLKQAIGGRVRGQIQSESPTEVVVKLGATTTVVPVDQIVSIRYDGQPATLQLAESRESGGQLQEAAELYRKAAAEAGGKPLVVQEALFREATVLAQLALVEPDRLKDAIERLSLFVQSHPASRHIVSARENLARLNIEAGNFSAASTALDELAKLPHGGERAAVLRARLQSAQGDHSAAIKELERVMPTLSDRSAARRGALLLKAECLVNLKRFPEAEELIRGVIRDSQPEDAESQAPAYNMLGDCLRAAGKTKDALLAYLHTDLLYSQNKQEHPRAMHHLERLFRQLNQDSRAEEYAQRLRQEYPRSPWLNASRD
jgi:tetratricopeptide (TPR) repeat protein